MSVSAEFQSRLQELVAETGIKRTKLAKDMNVDYRSFAAAYNYGILPKPTVLARISDYFNIPIAYLLGQTEIDAFTPAKAHDSFHERLKALCAERKTTYYRLAQDCHIDKSSISRWFSLEQIPSLETLEILSDHFDVSVDYLLGRTDDKK